MIHLADVVTHFLAIYLGIGVVFLAISLRSRRHRKMLSDNGVVPMALLAIATWPLYLYWLFIGNTKKKSDYPDHIEVDGVLMEEVDVRDKKDLPPAILFHLNAPMWGMLNTTRTGNLDNPIITWMSFIGPNTMRIWPSLTRDQKYAIALDAYNLALEEVDDD